MTAVGLAAVTLLGTFLRALPVIATDFPLNDGGLFLTMARDIRDNGWLLPATTTYNDAAIPFAYPPLGLYLVAVLEAAGIAGIDILRLVPVVASVATIPVVYLIGRAILRSKLMALATAAFFAVSTGSYEWLVMGGGVTRAPGLLFALLSILAAIELVRGGGRRWIVLTGVGLGVTGLWHPQAAVFAALSFIVILAFVAGRRADGARSLAGSLVIAVIVVAPWLAVVLASHGVDPILSAASTGGTPFVGLISLLSGRTSGGHFEVLGIATSVGMLIAAARGFWLAPVWAVAVVILDSRAGQPYLAVPAALAIAFLVGDAARVLGQRSTSGRTLAAGLAAVLVVASAVDSVAAQRERDSPLRSVAPAERAAMAWAAAETPGDATFGVVAGRYWAMDAVAEWFPVLAGRHSVATVQGHEWLGTDRFRQQEVRAASLAQCVVTEDAGCVSGWLRDAGNPDYLFLAVSPEAAAAGIACCLQLADQLGERGRATTVYDGGEVRIVRLDP